MTSTRLPRPLPPDVVARWRALPEWLQRNARHNTAIRECIEAHVVDGAPLEEALAALREYIHGPGYAGAWSADPAVCFDILQSLIGTARRPHATGGPGWR